MKHQEQDISEAIAAAVDTLAPAVAMQAMLVESRRSDEEYLPLLKDGLREVVKQKFKEEGELPILLQMLLAEFALNKPKGGRPVNFLERDVGIYCVVDATVQRGFHLTRNAESKKPTESASSIVSAALAQLDVVLSEKSVVRIWRDIDKSRDDPSFPWLIRSREALP